jgi:hypothetical protein
MVKKHVLDAFKSAEIKHKRSYGYVKIEHATDYVAKKIYLCPCFKGLLRDVLKAGFVEHEEYINNMIIRKRVKI